MYLLKQTSLQYKNNHFKKQKSSYNCSSKRKLIMAHARKEGHKNYLKHFNSK